MIKTLRAARFLFTGPLILALLFAINLLTSPGHWWVQWAALGIGIAWVISLIRVLCAVVLLGGLAALLGCLWKKQPLAAGWAVPLKSCKSGPGEKDDHQDVVISV